MRKIISLLLAVVLGASLLSLSGCGQVQIIGLDGETLGTSASENIVDTNMYAGDAVMIADALYPNDTGYARTAYFNNYVTIDKKQAMAYDVYEETPDAKTGADSSSNTTESGGGFGGILDSVKNALGLGEQKTEAEVVPTGKFIARVARLTDDRVYYVQAGKGNSWNRVRTEGTVVVAGGSANSTAASGAGGNRLVNSGESETFSMVSGISVIHPAGITATETVDEKAGTGSFSLKGTGWFYFHDWSPAPDDYDLSAERDSRESTIRLALTRKQGVTDFKWTGESEVMFKDSLGALRTRHFTGTYDGKKIVSGSVYYTVAGDKFYRFFLIETDTGNTTQSQAGNVKDGGIPKAIFDSAIRYSG